MNAAIALTDPLSLLLIVAVVVLCVTTVAMIVGGAGRASARSHRARSGGARLGAVPVVPLITATPRRAAPPIPAVHRPIETDPGRQGAGLRDGRPRRATNVDEAQRLVDHLAETNPERLAEIITQWINEDDTTTRDRR